jgi:hypothetical protein
VCVRVRARVLCGSIDLSRYFSRACAEGTHAVEQTVQGTHAVEQTVQGTIVKARRKETSSVML